MGFWKRQKDMFQGVTSPEFAEFHAGLDTYGDSARLMQTGIPGRAVIERATDTGMTVDERAIAELVLTVSVDGRDPYRVTTRQPAPRLMPGAFAPGATIPVRVDPQDPGLLIYDHAAHALGT
jgi:hypothetical protein